jgi:hypothetical protein
LKRRNIASSAIFQLPIWPPLFLNRDAQNVDFCLNVHISDLTYIWKLIVYTSGTCVKKPSWFLDMRIRIYFFDDFLAVGPWSTWARYSHACYARYQWLVLGVPLEQTAGNMAFNSSHIFCPWAHRNFAIVFIGGGGGGDLPWHKCAVVKLHCVELLLLLIMAVNLTSKFTWICFCNAQLA